jgi:hypothetical protein
LRAIRYRALLHGWAFCPYHRQVYEFAYHRPKLALLRQGALDEKRKGDAKFAPLADFIESVPRTCPHELFRNEDGSRGSQLAATFIDIDRLIVRAVQRSLLNVMENIDLRPPRAVAKRS